MATHSSASGFRRHLSLAAAIRLVVAGLFLYIVAAGLTGLRGSLHALRSADGSYLLLAMAAVVVTYALAAFTYKLLAPKRLPYGELFMVQLAGCLVNRLLPGGLGGLGINAYYFRRHGHTTPVAGAIVALNNLLGFVGNLLLLLLVFAAFSVPLPAVHIPRDAWYIAGLIVVLVVPVLWFARQKYRNTVLYKRSSRQLAGYFRAAGTHPGRLAGAVLSSMALTSLHVTALCLVLKSLGLPMDFAAALLAISAGALAGGVVPSPGGLGGAEAGIAALLVLGGLPVPAATLAALTYRGLTYWLPLLPGYAALLVVERNYL